MYKFQLQLNSKIPPNHYLRDKVELVENVISVIICIGSTSLRQASFTHNRMKYERMNQIES